MKRRWFWLLAMLIPAVIGAGYLVVPVNESPISISQAMCDRIEIGWTAYQVQDLLGTPGEPQTIFCATGLSAVPLSWADSDDNRIFVSISLKNRTVTEKRFVPSEFSFYERIKRRIERRLKAVWP
jgi:hypothetical protein